jgi:hypothetical protein
MIRGSTKGNSTKLGMVPGGVGSGKKPLPPIISKSPMTPMNPLNGGAFIPGANQGTRIMGWDGVKNTQPERDNNKPGANGVVPSQMLNPLGKVGGGNKKRLTTLKPGGLMNAMSASPTNVTLKPTKPTNQSNKPFTPSPPSTFTNKPISPQNTPKPKAPTRNPSQVKVSTSPGTTQVLDIQQQQQMEELKNTVSQLQSQIDALSEKVSSIEWDSYIFEADVVVPSGVDAWTELPSESNDIHIHDVKMSTLKGKSFTFGEKIKLSYPIVEFQVTMEDNSIQKWRFARSRIFIEEGWRLSDVFFPLEISSSFLPESVKGDNELITTVGNVRV